MKTKTTTWKIADYLRTPEQRAFYIEAAIEESQKDGDMNFLATALSDVAKAVGSERVSVFFDGVSAGLAATQRIALPEARKRSARTVAMA